MKFSTASVFLFCVCLIFGCGKEDNEPPVIEPPVIGFGSSKVEVIQDRFEGTDLVLVGNPADQYMVAYNRRLPDGTLLEFQPLKRAIPNLMVDQEGNKWDFHGQALEGPRAGQRLSSVHSYIGFWFAWSSMYPDVELYDGAEPAGGFSDTMSSVGWSVPTDHVVSVLGKDAIPAVDFPQFSAYDEKDDINNGYLIEDNELVIGIRIGEELRLYPHRILNWHEVVNDQIDDTYLSVSFCPLTGTALAWNREIDDEVTTFGVSGLLYNSNVIPYDRKTESFWSQMKAESIRGSLLRSNLELYPVVETTWATWKAMEEAPLVLTTNTGIGKDYSINPYEDYLLDEDFIAYPISIRDKRLPEKERVLGVTINGKARVYRFRDFDGE